MKNNKNSLKKKFKIADDLLKEITIKRDSSTCQRCHKEVSGRNCHVSHVYAKGSHRSMRWIPENVKILCFHCHRFFWHSDTMEAREWFVNEFPERAELLLGLTQRTTIINEAFMDSTIKMLQDWKGYQK